MWNFYEEGRFLQPLKFSNGKTQEDVVKEVVDAIKSGERIIFIKGVCGSGKSAIALHIAKELGNASLVVPIKALQRQYVYDYTFRKVVYKDAEQKQPLRLSLITGRQNHPCLFLQEHPEFFERRRERDSTLFGSMNSNNYSNNSQKFDSSANNPFLPCKIEIKDRNQERIRMYLASSPTTKKYANDDIALTSRVAVASTCQYWSPLLPAEVKPNLDFLEMRNYRAVDGDHVLYMRKPGCSYYKQFQEYSHADVILFNSAQYLLECAIGRKPSTEVEIIDECDEFLDSFSSEGTILLPLLSYDATMIVPEDDKQRELVNELRDIIFEVIEDAEERIISEELAEAPLKETSLNKLVSFFIEHDAYKLTDDDESYIYQCSEICRNFTGVTEDSFVRFSQNKEKKELQVQMVTLNLKRVFDHLLDKNKAFVFMSGTLHSPQVLKDIFGLDEFKIILAEDKTQGTISTVETGFEAEFNYENMRSGRFTRAHYLKALNKCVESSNKPTLVHVNSFSDLPTDEEKERYQLSTLITRDDLRQTQNEDFDGQSVREFRDGDKDVLFTTRCNRGVDFPGKMCNSVVLTKYPYPDAGSLFWKILRKKSPEIFWEFYRDKAYRELLQRVYRSVRFAEDKVDVLSPDSRVLAAKFV